MSDALLIVMTLVPAFVGIVGFLVIKPKTKDQREKFDSQIVNIKNGKTVPVEFKPEMTEAEIKTVIETLEHIK